ncbi:hypothetical protein ACFPZ0_09555 [Streptomonospora nanhaiensis]|uniref:hypothetical protein n=1 Tax=Streptomonospora nanhaiensis TaxID=1323731 RepID=UPI001C998C36|nr:hypothetical protein [Streptomonospora nanhaiensis]MBX9388861.1 hypothetical protein [Streptomonospora nanhaiensis]
MSRGKRLPPTRFPLPLRLAAALPVGTLVVGSGLVGFAPPAAASDAPLLSFAPAAATVDPGQPAESTLTVSPGGADPLTERVCLGDLTVDNGFTAEELTEPEPPATAVVSGKPDSEADVVRVTARLSYAVIAADRDCADYTGPYHSTTQTIAPFTVRIRQPEPTPTPTPTPSTTPPSSPPQSSSPPPPSGSDGGGSGGGSSGGGDRGSESDNRGGTGDRGGTGTGRGGSTAPPHSPVTTRDDLGAPESRGGLGDGPADLPELPEGDPLLPGLEPPSGDDPLADLPTVEPGEGESDGTSEVAARESSPASAVTPAVLLLFLLLLLLFSTPLAPARRVRTGPTAYRGRRRKR